MTSLYVAPIEKLLWPLCLLLWVAVALTSGYLRWIVAAPTVLLTIWLVFYFFYHNAAKWRRFYFRLMVLYSRGAGAALTLCDSQGIPFDPDIVFSALLQRLYPTEPEIESFLRRRDRWRHGFEDHDMFAKTLRKAYPNASREQLDSTLSYLKTTLQSAEPSQKVLTTVAYLIQDQLGRQAAEDFWVRFIKGEVK